MDLVYQKIYMLKIKVVV